MVYAIVLYKKLETKMKNSYIIKNTLVTAIIGLISLSTSKENEVRFKFKDNKMQKISYCFMNMETDDFTNLLNDNVDFTPLIEKRADKIVTDYIDTVQNRVYDLASNREKQNHSRNLYQRFGSGAPAMNGRYAYCLWGERKSLQAAIAALNLNIDAFPETNACPTMISMMRQQNPESSFYGKIWEDRKAFLVAREKLNDEHKVQFDKTNIAADDIKPGSIYSTNEHTEMFLGRGKIVNKRFVADNNGRFYKIGFNIEMIRPVNFYNGKINDIFIGNTYNLMIKKLQEQVEQIKNMPRDDLLSKAYKDGISKNLKYLTSCSDNELKIMLLERLLGTKLNPENPNTVSLIQWQQSRVK